MKKYILLQVFALFSLLGSGQITTLPVLPTATDQVVVTFDATLGSGNMAGYTGDVYAHTGVKIEGNPSWQYVIGSWGNNATQPKLTRIGADKYTLTIGPSIREYYGVPAHEKIVQMCFVFRASSGTPQTEDLFVDVVEEGLTVQISSPTADKPFYNYLSTITIEATANLSTSISLFINSTEVASTTNEQITYSHTTDSYGLQWVKAIASDGTNQVADSAYFYVPNEVPIAPLPANVTPGVNVTGDNEVTLVLHDPSAKKESVFAIGDFCNWMPHDDFYMNRTPDGTHYWVTLSNLNPTQEYIYQYWVDGTLKLADPYTHKVSDPWNDKYISENNYPNLVQYPQSKTTGIASVFQVEENLYTWQSEDFNAPKKSELIIYELHIRDFVEDDAIKSVTDHLDYLQRLGINAIELMPINEFEGNDSWGYNPSFYFAADKAYGTPNHYKEFIDECHKRGMAVIIDMVLNHSFGQSPFVQLYFDENAGEWGQPTADNPWYNQTCPHPPYCWGYDLNHLSIYTQDLIDRIAEYWLTEYKVDGFRLDFTKGFTNYNSGNEGWNYNSQRIGILKRFADHIWSVNPNAYVILEHFTENSEEKELAEYRSNEGLGMLIWGNMNYNYNEASMGWLGNSNFSGVSYKQRGWNVPHLISYMESHDEERLMYKNLTYGNSANPSHDIKSIDIALRRQQLVGAFFFPVPGPKMIWQFGELGYDFSIEHNGRTGRKPVRWDYYDSWGRRRLYNVWAELIALKKAYPVFSTADFSISFSGAGKYYTLLHNEMNVVIAGNFDVTAKEVIVPFPNTGKWYDYYEQTEFEVSNSTQTLLLQPGEYKMFTTNYINRDDYILAVENESKVSYSELKVWPNPSSTQLSIEFTLTDNQPIDIGLFDISGRKVFTLYSGNANVGTHTFTYDLPKGLNSGVYILKVANAHNLMTKKVIIQP